MLGIDRRERLIGRSSQAPSASAPSEVATLLAESEQRTQGQITMGPDGQNSVSHQGLI